MPISLEHRLRLGDGQLDVLDDGLVLVERRLLQENADARALLEVRLAVVRPVETGHELEHRRLACAVRPDDADLGAGEERQRDVVEDDLVSDRLADVVHGVDELGHSEQIPFALTACQYAS